MAINMVNPATKEDISAKIWLCSRLMSLSSIRKYLLTNVYIAGDEPKEETGSELELLHQHGFYHVEHRHRVNLATRTQK